MYGTDRVHCRAWAHLGMGRRQGASPCHAPEWWVGAGLPEAVAAGPAAPGPPRYASGLTGGARRAGAAQYAKIVQRLGFPATFKDFKVQNIVGSCDVRFPIRLEGLSYSHGMFCSVRARGPDPTLPCDAQLHPPGGPVLLARHVLLGARAAPRPACAGVVKVTAVRYGALTMSVAPLVHQSAGAPS